MVKHTPEQMEKFVKNAKEQFSESGSVLFEVGYTMDSQRSYTRFEDLDKALGAIQFACRVNKYVRVFNSEEIDRWNLKNAILAGEVRGIV